MDEVRKMLEIIRRNSLKRKEFNEVIDGVTIVHTGMTRERKLYCENGGYVTEEVVKMYDENGNRFYSNAESLEEAQKYIDELAEKGITAVIGPKAPYRGKNGKFIPNPEENTVGVFIVKQLKKQEVPKRHR